MNVTFRRIALPAALAAAFAAVLLSVETPLFPVLKNSLFAGPQKEGFSLLVTSQILRPWGDQASIAGRPVEGVFDSEGRWYAVLGSRGVEIFDAPTMAHRAEVLTRATSYGGLAFRAGTHELWVCETTGSRDDSIAIATLGANGSAERTERLGFKSHTVPAGLAFSPGGKTVYATLSASNTVAVIDADNRELLREIPVGIAPMAIAVARQTGRIYVANRGGRRPKPGETTAFTARSEVLTEPVTGSSASGTLSVLDPRNPGSVSEYATGLAPSSIAISEDGAMLAIANAHSDSVSIFDTVRMSSVEVRIPSFPEGTFGSQPVSVAFAPGGKRLYVACAGINALGIVEQGPRAAWRFVGALPAAWFPVSVAVAVDGGVRVVAVKGTGNNATRDGGHNTLSYEGTVSSYPPALLERHAAGLREVRAANAPQFEPAGGVANLASLGIRHVFLIIKENRTYDQVLSDLPRGERDPRYLMYGRDVTPNQHALAEQYVLLDNFYTSSEISFDGHQWLTMAFVSDYVQRAFAASPRGYSWNMDDALTVAPTGFFWQGAPRQIDVRLMGEATNPARWDPAASVVKDINESDLQGWEAYWKMYQEGRWREAAAARPAVPALGRLVDRSYPTSTMNITDQIRAEAFLERLRAWEENRQAPELAVITLTSDHTMGTRPGFPTPRAMVADDDFALGRMVEALSKSSFWAQTLVLVTEDDAQDGVDHVDGHRTVCFAIGPHVRRGALDSTHYTHASLLRTIQAIFRIPPRTRFLAAARPMTSIFQPRADLTPYTVLQPRISLTEMNQPLSSLRGRQREAALASLRFNPNHVDDIPTATMNRILWWEAKGYSVPYPVQRAATAPRRSGTSGTASPAP